VIAALVLIIFGAIGNNSTRNSPGNKPYYNQSTETKFSSSVKAGANVYADIVSIFPAIGIYTQGASSYSDLVCECETASGVTVWVHMPTSKYKKYFDSDISTSVHASIADAITFTSSKRIHGIAKKADTVLSGLSSDIGATMLIDFKSVNE